MPYFINIIEMDLVPSDIIILFKNVKKKSSELSSKKEIYNTISKMILRRISQISNFNQKTTRCKRGLPLERVSKDDFIFGLSSVE